MSCISANICQKARRRLQPSNITIKGVDGNLQPVLGETTAILEIGTVRIQHRFVVLEKLHPASVILGCDLLSEHDISIHLQAGCITFNRVNVSVPIRQSKEAPQTCRLVSAASVQLQPGQHWIIPIRPAQPTSWTQSAAPGIITGTKRQGLLLARCIAKLADSGMGLAAINISDQMISITDGDAIGNFSPLGSQPLIHLAPAGSSATAADVGGSTATVATTAANKVARAMTCVASASVVARPPAEWLSSIQIEPSISAEEQQSVKELLLEFTDVFASPGSTGQTAILRHRIDTGVAQPIRQGLRRAARPVIDKQAELVDDMLTKGVIRPSSSPWASPIVLVKKKDGTARFCLDYRLLNEVTKPDAFPIPRIDDTLDALEGNAYFSALDLESGYWQVEVDERDKEKTAFICHQGLFEFNVMPFGLRNAPATFQRLMQLVLQGLTWQACLVFIDDVIIMGRTITEHNDRLRAVLERLREANLRLKPSKCRFANTSMIALGHRVSKAGIAVDESKTAAVRDWPTPRNSKEVKSFLGLTSYYRRFVRNYSKIAEPLRRLTLPTERFQWTPAAEAAFNELKVALTSAPILAFPDTSPTSSEYILDTDASDCAVGAVLSQVQAGVERVIAYSSRALSKAERNYCVTRRELLSVVEHVRKFRTYLLPRRFTVRVDHQSLTHLLTFKEPEGQLARWLQALDEFDFKVVFRPGRQHNNADSLSRRQQRCTNQCRVCRPDPAFTSKATSSVACQTDDKVEPAVVVRVNVASAGQSGPTRARPAAVTEVTNVSALQSRRKQELRPLPNESEEESSEDEAPEDSEAPADCGVAQPLRTQQLHDPIIGPVFRLLSDGKSKFSEQQRDRVPPESLLLAQKGHELCFVNGIMHRLINSKPVPVVPCSLQRGIIDEIHGIGHLGEDKTLASLKMRYYWPKMADSVRLAVRSCEACQRAKTPVIKRAPLQSIAAGFPMQRVGFDVVKVGVSKNGNDRLLTIVDYFSKWVELVPIPDEKATTIAAALFNNWIARWGAPHILHSDRGRSIDGRIIRSLCKLLDISKTRTSGYHPQCDGLVERFHRTLHHMLRCHLQAVDPLDWEDVLPHCLLAYRSSINATTGFSPHFLMTGREVVLPLDVVYRVPEPPAIVGQYAAETVYRLQNAFDTVRRATGTAQRRQRRYYDLKAQKRKFRAGDIVWLFVPPAVLSKTNGLPPKHQAPWTGPFKVLCRTSPVNYLVRPVDYKDGEVKGRVVHVNKMKRAHQPRPADGQQDEVVSDVSTDALDADWVIV